MGKESQGTVRFRVVFDEHSVLNNSELSDGLGRCWLLLKPSIATFADLASDIREKFSLRNSLVLFIDDFVLPPFETTRILKDKDIIRVKLKDALLPCDGQNIVQDPQIARSDGHCSNNITMPDEKSQVNSQVNRNDENDGTLCLNIGMLEQKREHSLELHNSMRKRHKLNCNGKQVTSVDVQDKHSRQNRTSCHVSCDSKMELAAEYNTHDDRLAVAQPFSEVSLGEPSSYMPCKGRQQYEGINNALESEPHITCNVTKDHVQSSVATSKNDQNQFTAMTFEGRNHCSDVHEKKSSGFCMENHAWIDRKLEGDSPNNKAKTPEHRIDFATLFPLTRSPLKGDILAYKYVEPSSTVFPLLSSPQVGKVTAFDHKSSEIVLVPAPEFEVFSEEVPMTPSSLPTVSPYKEDGSLEIKLSALVDVRLLKAHNSKELACLPEETFNRTKIDKWDVALAKSIWNQSNNAHHTGGSSNGTVNGRRASKPWFYGTSPAAALFWETVLSKGTFGKGGKCSSSGKY